MKAKRFRKIYIEITNICNLNCSFCPNENRKKETMSAKKFEEIINKIKNFTNLIALHVKGEPLLHPELKEILDICKENEILVNITTNATLLENKLKILLNSKSVRQLNLSLHSINKNENTKNYNTESYINSILKCSDEILQKTNIIISYRLWNLANIEENNENFRILEILGNHFNQKDLIVLARENNFVKLSQNAFLNQDVEFIWPSLDGKIFSEEGTCLGLRNQIAILVNGDVVPCCLDQNGDIKLGNIFEENLEDILEKEISKKIIKGFEENKVLHNLCKRCGFRDKFCKKY